MNSNVILFNNNCNNINNISESIDTIITDPPYNVNFKYNNYKDNLSWDEYYKWQEQTILNFDSNLTPSGNILWLNYPESAAIFYNKLSNHYYPVEWINWIYHCHTSGKPLRKASRAWIWFSKTEIPFYNQEFLQGEYQNPTDKRIKKKIEQGKKPVEYDWWWYEQVKNVSTEKTDHPCQLPLEMVERLVQATCPISGTVLDMFMGSATVGEACIKHERNFIGIEQDKDYFNIAVNRLEKYNDKNQIIIIQ